MKVNRDYCFLCQSLSGSQIAVVASDFWKNKRKKTSGIRPQTESFPCSVLKLALLRMKHDYELEHLRNIARQVNMGAIISMCTI